MSLSTTFGSASEVGEKSPISMDRNHSKPVTSPKKRVVWFATSNSQQKLRISGHQKKQTIGQIASTRTARGQGRRRGAKKSG